VFYVDGNAGSDSDEGTDPNFPLLTIATALGKCTSWKYDYIMVLAHYQETWPVTINKAGVRILGTAWNGITNMWLTPSGDTAIFEIEEDEVEIAGFEFGAGAAHGAIEFTATKGYGHIHHNAFGWMQTSRDGIWVIAPFDAAGSLIECNRFGNNLSRDGVRIDHNMTRGEIMDNIFRDVTGIGIDCTASLALAMIGRNQFKLPSDTGGKAITLSAVAGTEETYVFDNEANFGGSNDMGNNPYVVTGGVADTVTFDGNRRNGTVVNPA